MKNILLKVKNLTFSYGDQSKVLRDFNLQISQGEVISLLGPSGAGKTTLLRLIAGFERMQQGSLHYLNHLIDKNHFIPPQRRRIGMVFQEGALFPHLKVKENILFPLSSWDKKEKQSRLEELLELFSLKGLQNQYPFQLSGGQEKRVAVARALAFSPQLLLMDEPFSHLDVALKEELLLELRECFKEMNMAILFVTHDRKEAFTFSDELAVLESGRLHQKGPGKSLYQAPKTSFVFQCLGEGSSLPIDIRSDKIQSELGCFPIHSLNEYYLKKIKNRAKAWLYIRPEQVVFDETSPFKVTVEHSQYFGPIYQLKLKLPSGLSIDAVVGSQTCHLKTGETVRIRLELKESIAFEQRLP